MESFNYEFENALVNFEKNKAYIMVENYIKERGTDNCIDEVIVNVLGNIGEKWDRGELSLAQVYLSSKICEEIITKLFPENQENNKRDKKIAIVTLEDHHVLGKRIVKSTLHSAGFHIIDFGFGVSADELIEKVIKEKIEILLISVLMYPSALKVREVREKLKNNNINIKILVGGAPFNFDAELWKNVGANAMGKSAAESVEILKQWTEV